MRDKEFASRFGQLAIQTGVLRPAHANPLYLFPRLLGLRRGTRE